MKRLLRITVLFSVTLLWWGEKGYAAFVVNNGAVCPVGGKVDYKYESVK